MFYPGLRQREAAEARRAAAARDFEGSGSGRGSFLTKTGGSGSGRGSDVIIAVIMLERTFQELSFEPNQSSVALFINKLSLIENVMLGCSLVP